MKRGSKRKDKGCPRCAELERIVREQRETIRQLERRSKALERRVRELEERLGLNCQNSSNPPSRDPLDAPARPKKKPTGRRRGAQPGHKGTQRELLPLEEVDEVVAHVPDCCETCKKPLPKAARPGDPPPLRHQVTELVEKPYTVTEHQTHGRVCCGKTTWAEVPPEHRSAFGPRLTGLVAALTGMAKVPRRPAQEILSEVLGIAISLGSVSALEGEVSESLAESHVEVAVEIEKPIPKNVDETGWKQAGKRCWLWTAATSMLALFVIHERRGKEGFAALLSKVAGMITTDRWQVYASIANKFRQICWAHLKRDFKRLSERSGEAGELGAEALAVIDFVFTIWHEFKAGKIDRPTLNQCLCPFKRELRRILERGVGLHIPKISAFCENLLALETALWNFARHEGVEPTNNHAERVLRPAVIWRKRSFGCDSERGCRYAERILTASASCRLQGRSIYQFIVDSVIAHRTGTRPPSLLPHNV